jgi:hypothetical protein
MIGYNSDITKREKQSQGVVVKAWWSVTSDTTGIRGREKGAVLK